MGGPNGAGTLLRLIRGGEAVTRAELARRTGLSRSTVGPRVDALLARSLVYEVGDRASTGGRPPTMLAFNDAAGTVLVADLGATHSRVGVMDLAGQPLAEEAFELDINDDPGIVLEEIDRRLRGLCEDQPWSGRPVRGIGVGIPAVVSFGAGKPVSPPIMPAWDGFPVADWFAQRHGGVPVLVDNDVNIMALGEHWSYWRDTDHLLFIKVGTGIGCGAVVGGAVHRGAQGAAGDIGHIQVSGEDATLCRCGNANCLEAVASGSAVALRLTELGLDAANSREVVAYVRAGEPQAVALVREAGRRIGEVLAACVNLLNPDVIVIGGDLAEAHEQLLAGVREVTFQRSTPLATQKLQTATSRLGDRAGITGAAIMVIEHILAPEAIDRTLMEVA